MLTNGIYWLVFLGAIPIFWRLPENARLWFLGLLSFGFLLTIDMFSVISLAILSCAFYYFGSMKANSGPFKRITSILVIFVIGFLAYFKYLPGLVLAFEGEPTLQNVIIPLGISYFTFKLVHYAIEVRRKNIPTHSLGDFYCYLFLAPIFTAGPIERFEHFLKTREPEWNSNSAAVGISRIAHGLIKKFVIANLLILPLFGSVSDVEILLIRLDELPAYKVWGFFALSFLYLYFDFSAYSDIAIGTSRLFGLRIMENFNWPLLATDLGVFWKRWHMTLANWCQTYVYLPLIGLTRNPYIASYASFMIMGLWHSGSVGWLMWGVWHATGVSCLVWWIQFKRRRKWKYPGRLPLRYLGIFPTMAWVVVGGVFPLVAPTGQMFDIALVLFKLLGIDL